MKTVGSLIRTSREAQGMSLRDLSRKTKIKEEFLESLEFQKWEKLPELPVVLGFVKSIADELSVNREQAVALLRRDYPPKNLLINPNPDLKKEFRLGPRFLASIVVFVLICVAGAYLLFQYSAFRAPPSLTVISPVQGELVTGSKLTVIGTTTNSAAVRVNGQPVLVSDSGNFTVDIEVAKELTQVEIKAISRSGRETVVIRSIDVQLPKK